MKDSILDSLISAGDVTEVQILTSLHTSGVIDVKELIAGKIKTATIDLFGGKLSAKMKINMHKECSRYHSVLAGLYEIELEEVEDKDIDTPVSPSHSQTVTVSV